MALARRSGQRFQPSIWPGFVDAMTGLLLVLMFVLMIFMVVQFVLRDTISGQEQELGALSQEVAALSQALGLEQDKSSSLTTQVGSLTAALSDARDRQEAQTALIDRLTRERDAQAQALADAGVRITGFEAQVAGLLAERAEARDLIASLEDTQTRMISEAEALNLALAQARDEIDAEAEAARLAAARADALEQLATDLRADMDATQTRLDTALADAAAAAALRAKLADADAELTAMTLSLEAQRAAAEQTLTLLAAARNAQGDLEARLAAAVLARDEAQAALTDLDPEGVRAQLAAALAAQGVAETQAQSNVAALAEAQARLAEEQALSTRAQRDLAALNAQVADLRREVASLQGLLDIAEESDREAQVQITSLGERLNTALARVATEQRRRAELEEAERLRLEEEAARLSAEAENLESYRSDFFGEMRRLLEGQAGVRVVGDRFVFSSEVLFSPGKADLSDDGKAQISRVAATLLGLSERIPAGIDWIIRVDGHTDDVALSGQGEFADNWELSQARALSVVRYMVDDLGFPPQRLAANGFGEFWPIAAGNSPVARAQNRRIELKLTER